MHYNPNPKIEKKVKSSKALPPHQENIDLKISMYQAELDCAIENEDYERATLLKDMLIEYKKRNSNNSNNSE
jgi:protein-arginine kinase activator protein McsA